MISTYVWDGTKLDRDVALAELKPVLADSAKVVWVDLEAPSADEITLLSEAFGFHPLAIEDCCHFTEIPKFEEFSDYLFLRVHGVNYTTLQDIAIVELDAFCGKNFAVTVHTTPVTTVGVSRAKLAQHPERFAKGAPMVLHDILDRLIDNYFPLVSAMDEQIDGLEEKVLAGEGANQHTMGELMYARRRIFKLKRTIAPHREVMAQLARQEQGYIPESALAYFRDIYDHVVRLYEFLDLQRELVANVFEVYLTINGNRLAEISNRMNKVMQRLTVISTLFLPLTFLVGVYGMNFYNMPEYHWRYGYATIWALMLGVAWFMWRMFRKLRWV